MSYSPLLFLVVLRDIETNEELGYTYQHANSWDPAIRQALSCVAMPGQSMKFKASWGVVQASEIPFPGIGKNLPDVERKAIEFWTDCTVAVNWDTELNSLSIAHSGSRWDRSVRTGQFVYSL